MAKWNKNKVSSDLINNGNEFTSGDNLAVNELNAIVNNSFYASEKAENAEKLAESAVKGNGTLVTINGQIQGEWSADFAEAERQKSKNLFDINKLVLNHGVITGNVITTQYQYNNSRNNLKDFADLEIGKTYILSLKTTSNADYIYLNGTNQIWRNEWTMTITQAMLDAGIVIYGNRYELDGVESTTSEIMIEEGSVVTEYHPYNGQIVHENDVSDVVRTRDVANFETTENKTASFSIIDHTRYPSMLGLSYAHQGGLRYGFTGETDDDLLNWVKNEAPQGYYHFYWSHGLVEGVDVLKASSQYATVVKTDYWISSPRYINCLAAGEWSGWKHFTLS